MGPQDDTGWFARNLQHLSDMVIVISPDTTVIWGNDAVERILGWATDDFVGRSFADFLHPDDIDRAIEVASLVDQDVFVEDAVRPALYRVRTADDDWMTIELNSAVHPADDGLLVVMGRFTGDLVHSTRLLTAVTRGAPVHEQVAITLDLGKWRYPRHGYVVVYRVADGYAAIASDGVPIELIGPESSLGELPWRHAVAAGEPFEVVDLADGVDRRDVIPEEVLTAATDAGFVGVLALPVADDGYGEDAAIVVWSRRAGSALVGHRYAIESMVQALDLVLQQRAQRLKLEQAAYTDLLTGVPSRRRFLDLIDEADDRPGGDVGHAVLYIDLDHFKQVNDAFGHAIGDRVLAAAAGRLAAALPADAAIGRLGGDEFGVLCAPGTDESAAAALAAALTEALDQPIPHEEGRVVVGASIGIHVGPPGQRALEVLDLADRALLAAKGDRGDRSSTGDAS